MQNKSLISIIIPVYNREHLLAETLDSVLGQTYPHWECIIVDDGSTDATVEIIKQHVEKDSRFRFYARDREPKGAPTCRNIGLDNAKGEFVIFLDSDDLLAWWCLEERVKHIEQDKEFDFAVFPVIAFEKRLGDSKRIWSSIYAINDLYSFLQGINPWSTPSPIFRKNYLINEFYWDETALSSQEIIFFIKLLKKYPKYIKPDVLPDCFIRSHSGEERIANKYFEIDYCWSRQLSYEKINRMLNKGKEKRIFLWRLFNETRMLNIMGININPIEYFRMGKKIHLPLYYLLNLTLWLLLTTNSILYRVGIANEHTLVRRFIPKKMNLYSTELEERRFKKFISKLNLKTI